MTSFIGVICGLKSEAAAVRKSVGKKHIRIGVSGADAERAYNLARAACADGAAAIISVGVSGGLDPALKPGDLIVSDDIVADDGAVYASDHYLKSIILKEIGSGAVKVGRLFGADDIIVSAQQKGALFYNHEAIAVDMESHGCARAASETGVPFIAIRAIADPANRALPKAALGAVAPDGSTRTFATLGRALMAPQQFPALMKLGADSDAALKTLRRDLGPLFRRFFLTLDL